MGPDYPLMLDCYMALTVPYAIKLAKQLQPFNLKWMEEFLHPVRCPQYQPFNQEPRSFFRDT